MSVHAALIVHHTHVSLCFSVLPGFGPAAEVLLFRQKDPKPLTPCSADEDGTDARGRADQLAALRQGPQDHRIVRPRGGTAGVGPWETNSAKGQMKKRGTLYLYDPACSVINFLAVGFRVGDDFGNACRKLIAKYIWHVVH